MGAVSDVMGARARAGTVLAFSLPSGPSPRTGPEGARRMDDKSTRRWLELQAALPSAGFRRAEYPGEHSKRHWHSRSAGRAWRRRRGVDPQGHRAGHQDRVRCELRQPEVEGLPFDGGKQKPSDTPLPKSWDDFPEAGVRGRSEGSARSFPTGCGAVSRAASCRTARPSHVRLRRPPYGQQED